ncbi:MAG: Npt1/Npt2 family nucleotide transporter [Candidatus Omnitrophica bacterium]|nr:Npt1/Npt2 family nucleotide transporter [Candidatus Omnitrophota bacterium]MDD5539951.1 Npt1/Npt2 family nucleotide transporter [Candidatus Neomarinimicrobiota bacterium]
MIKRFLAKWYGNFTREELIRALLLGAAFALIIGTYWTLRPLKDALFKTCIIGEGCHKDASPLALAKMISVAVLIPVVMLYSRLVDRFKRQSLFYVIGGVLICGLLIFSFLFNHPTLGLDNKVASSGRLLGWAWYVFVEAYGSLLIALFWAYASDSIDAESAKKSFFLIVMFGQFGGIIGPQSTDLPVYFGFRNCAPLIVLCAVNTAIVVLIIRQFALRLSRQVVPVPAEKMHLPDNKKGGGASFIEGLRLLVTDKYLFGIFLVISFYEIIVTIFDFNFKRLAFQSAVGDVSTARLLGDFGTAVNSVSFICLALGIGNVQRKLGMKMALCAMPFIIGMMVIGFKLSPSVSILFWIMVAGKALNYALNSPSLKQLYIPTSEAAKYKAQAWIEMFGSRSAKACGSGVNALLKVFQARAGGAVAGFAMYVTFASSFSVVLLVFWFFVALSLSKEYDRRVKPVISEG